MFNKGLRKDELALNAYPGSWRDARNILLTKGFQAASNEYGFAVDTINTNYGTYLGAIPFTEGYIAFYTRNNKFLILKKTATTETIILETAYIVGDVNYPIEGVFKFNYRRELIICWTNNQHRPYLLNVDNLPFAVDGFKELVTPSYIVRAYLFPDMKLANYALNEEREGGYGFPEGVIQVCLRYKIQDFDFTSCTSLSNPIPVKLTRVHTVNKVTPNFIGGTGTPSPNYNGDWIFADTFQSDTIKKSFNLDITDIDTRYEEAEVIVLCKSHTGISAKIFSRYALKDKFGNPVTTLNVTLDGFKGEDISVAEVIVPRFSCSTIKTMTKLNDQLVVGNVKTRDTLKWQKYANMITVTWNTATVPATVSEKSTLPIFDKYLMGDAVNCYRMKTWQPNEVYALYAHLVLTDGTITEGYHIPGRPPGILYGSGGTLETDTVFTSTDQDIRPNAQIFHLYDTAHPAGGSLGFWQNENEKYPIGDDFNSTIDYNGGGLGGSDLRGEKVRHHRMPTNGKIYPTATSISPVTPHSVITLQFQNVIIPPDLQDQVVGVIFSYAERTSGNRIVEAESKVMHVDFWNNVSADTTDYGKQAFRMYDFNLLWNKPTINPNYIKFVASRQDLNNQQSTSMYIGTAFNYKVKSIKYAPVDNDVLYNIGREECVYVEVPDTGMQFNTNGKFYEEGGPTAQLCNDLVDIYTDFYRQRTVSMGEVHHIAGAGTYSFNTGNYSLGGDVFLSRQHFQTVQFLNTANANAADDIKMYQWHTATVYSPLNYNFIYWKEGEKTVPYYHTFNDLYKIEDVNNLIDGSQYFRGSRYNNIFSSINNMVDYGVIDPYVIREEFAPHQVRRSIVFGSEQQGIGWRIFPANDYYEMPKHRGQIWKLYGRNKDLYILHEHSAYYATIKDVLATLPDATYVGTGDLFDRLPIEILTSERGTVGCRSQWGVAGCEFGIIVPDTVGGKVFLLQGEKAVEISDKGLRNWWTDIKVLQLYPDNPLLGTGIAATYDDDYKRALISVSNGNKSFTLSYSFEIGEGGGWVCFHDYISRSLFHNRFGLYSVGDFNIIFKHNNTAVTRGVYYDGVTKFPAYIDIPINKDATQTKSWSNIYWQTTVKDGNKTIFDETCTEVMLYTDDQCSGLIPISRVGQGLWFKGNARYLKDGWYLNEFRDLVIDPNQTIIDNFGVLNLGNINNSKVWFDKSKFISKFVVVRLQFNNQTKRDWFLHFATVNGTQAE